MCESAPNSAASHPHGGNKSPPRAACLQVQGRIRSKAGGVVVAAAYKQAATALEGFDGVSAGRELPPQPACPSYLPLSSNPQPPSLHLP